MGVTYRSKLSSKGQLVIPAEIRRRLRLRLGTEVTISEDKGRLVIEQRRQTFEDVFKFQGILKVRMTYFWRLWRRTKGVNASIWSA